MTRTLGRPARAASALDTMGPIGWLFADMLIGIVIIALGTQAVLPRPVAAPAPRTEASEVPAPADPPSRMELVPIVHTIKVDDEGLLARKRKASAQFRARLASAVAPLVADGRQAAMVLVFGRSPDVGAGMGVAEVAAANLVRAEPALFGGAAPRTFWKQGPSGAVRVEIYLFGTRR